MKYDFLKTMWKTLKGFLIALAIVAVGAVIQAFGGYVPEPGLPTMIWQACGAALIGLLTGFLNWLKNHQS